MDVRRQPFAFLRNCHARICPDGLLSDFGRLGGGLVLLRRAAAGCRSAERLFESHLETVEPLGGDGRCTAALRRWLLLAGYRNRAGAGDVHRCDDRGGLLRTGHDLFLLTTRRHGRSAKEPRIAPARGGRPVYPGRTSRAWLLFLMFAAMPWLAVRRMRRERVERVEQDLPIALELLSTLSEAGLGFDAALAHILESAVENRPLAREFRTYQADLLAGRSRVRGPATPGQPFGSLFDDDPRIGIGPGRTVGRRHRRGPAPPGPPTSAIAAASGRTPSPWPCPSNGCSPW